MAMQSFKPNLQGLQDYMANAQTGGGDINWYRFEAGTTTIRILPPWSARGLIALPVYSHRIQYSEPGSKFTKYSWTCVERTFGKPCNICRGLQELRAAGTSTEDWDPNERNFYANALVVNDPTMGRMQNAIAPWTHVLLRLPKTVYDWVVAQITNPQIGDITDVTHGIEIMVTKTGSGLETKYSPTLSPNGWTAVPEQVLQDLELYNLDDIFSSGFDDQRISNLMNALRSASMQMTASLPQYHTQANQYQYNPQVPVYTPNPASQNPPYNPPMPGAYATPGTPSYQAPAATIPPQPAPAQPTIPPSPYSSPAPYQAPASQPQPQPQPQPPTAPVPAQSSTVDPSLPKCFGHYDMQSPTCVVCPREVDCQQRGR